MKFSPKKAVFLLGELRLRKVILPSLTLLFLGANAFERNLLAQYIVPLNYRNHIGFREPEPYKCVGEPSVFVAPEGRDEGSGTKEDPLKSVAVAVELLGGQGGVIYLRGGTYFLESFTETSDNDWETKGASILISEGGTPSNYLQICNFPGETPLIDGSRLPDNIHSIQINYADNVRIAGLEVANGRGRAIVSLASRNVEIINNHVRDNWLNGISVRGSMNNLPKVNRARDSLIRDNVVVNNFLRNSGENTGKGLHGQGVQARNAENITITNNYIEHNYGEGLGCVSINGCFVFNNSMINNYSVNLYLDNANSSHFYNNFISATGLPEIRWHDKRDTNNIQIANENYKNLGYVPEFYTSDLTLKNNLVVGGHMGISYQIYSGAHSQEEPKSRGLKNTSIERNTFHQNETAVFFQDDLNSTNSIFKNNIVSSSNGDAVAPDHSGFTMKFDRNLWYEASPSNAASPSDIFDNPEYLNSEIQSPEDYGFKESSPAIELGLGADPR